MRPQEAEAKYLDILRRMSANQRLRIGAELYEMAYRIVRCAIEEESPGISEGDLKAKMRERVGR